MEDITQGLKETVNVDTVMKSWLVGYVGEQHNPKGDAVTVEMIGKRVSRIFNGSCRGKLGSWLSPSFRGYRNWETSGRI